MDNFRKRSRPDLAQFEAVHELCTTKLADRHEVMLYLRNDPSINPDTWDKKKKKLPAAALHMVVICTPRMLGLLMTCDVRTAQPPHGSAAARNTGATKITTRLLVHIVIVATGHWNRYEAQDQGMRWERDGYSCFHSANKAQDARQRVPS